MSSSTDQSALGVVIASNKMQAELAIPADYPPELLSVDVCLAELRGKTVRITDEVKAAVTLCVAAARKHPEREVREVVAEAIAPIHGKDGVVTWKEKDDGPARNEKGDVSHYDRSVYQIVSRGDVIGVVTPPTPGEDGIDVLGNAIAARTGAALHLQYDESIIKTAKGELIAQWEGVVARKDDRVWIRSLIEVDEYVDFTTGNIEFRGDVLVHKGIRDCFKVKATGDVEVRGMIEAATIECGGELRALGGFAGRERANATVGRDFVGRYADNVDGTVKGDLRIDREVINSDLVVHGSVVMPNGALIGGRTVVVGAVEIGSLGSGAAVPTELVIGTVPQLEPFREHLERLVKRLNVECDELTREQNELVNNSTKGRMTSVARERQTEIMWELDSMQQAKVKAEAMLEKIEQRIADESKFDVTVQRIMHYGTVIVAKGNAYKLYEQVRGPLQVTLNDSELVYRRGDADPKPLASISDVSVRNSVLGKAG